MSQRPSQPGSGGPDALSGIASPSIGQAARISGVVAPTAVGEAGAEELGFDGDESDTTAPGVEGTVPVTASSADLAEARAALDALMSEDATGGTARHAASASAPPPAPVAAAIRAPDDVPVSPAIAALMARGARPHRRAPSQSNAARPASPSASPPAAPPAPKPLGIDDELAAAMAEAMAAVSGRSTSAGPAPRPPAAASQEIAQGAPGALSGGAAGDEGIDLDVLGALDAAIAGAPGPTEAASLSAMRGDSTRAENSAPGAAPITAKPDKQADEQPVEQQAPAPADEDSLFETPPAPATRTPQRSGQQPEASGAATQRPVDETAVDVAPSGTPSFATNTPKSAIAAAINVHADRSSGLFVADPVSPPATPTEPRTDTEDGGTEGDQVGGESPSLAEQRAAADRAMLDALAAWMRLVKICAAPRADRELTLTAAGTTLGLLRAAGDTWRAELCGHAWFVDGRWLPVPAKQSGVLSEFVAAMRRAQCAGVWVTADATDRDVLTITQRFVRAVREKGQLTFDPNKPVGFLARPALAPHPESWAAGVAQRCVAFADLATHSAHFPEAQAVSLLDELQQAAAGHTAALMRAIELRGSNWTTPWGATSTVAITLATLSSVGASPRVVRAAALAAWALTLAAKRGELPPALPALAARARDRMPPMAQPWSPLASSARGLLHRLSRTDGPVEGTAALLQLLYHVHRSRLSGASDLLAAIMAHHRTEPLWASAVLAAVGPIPVGTGVALADGRRGLVVDLAPAEHPLRPLVQIGADLARPTADVTPLRRI